MPIYEYRCEACGKRSTALLPRYDATDPECPHCGAGDLRRLVSSFATQRSEGSALGGDDDWDGGNDYGEDGDDGDDAGDGDWGGGGDFDDDF